MNPVSLRIEPLESRIAPSVFFLSGSANTVSTVIDSDVVDANSATDAAAVSSTIAVKLVKGDSVVLDTNGNHLLDSGEITYAKITGGKAILFATDLDATVGFTAGEITGLAVSNGFKATITGNVTGSIATVLDAAGALTANVLVDASIAGLSISGRVTSSILAGKNISNVNIGNGTIDTSLSVLTIATGNAADDNAISFNGGGATSTYAFIFTAPGENGGNISNVTLSHGARKIVAGDGNGTTGAKGGAGGGITALSITSSGDFGDNAHISGGDGGDGNIAGAGGSLKGIKFNFSADVANYLYCDAGDGGDGLAGKPKAQGGNGGSVSNFTFNSTANIDFVGVYGGDGGDAGANSNGRGGNGGSVMKITYAALGGDYGPYVAGGAGGDGVGTGAGGAGGDALNVKASLGSTTNPSLIYGGEGGDGGDAGRGGRGGNVINFDHSCADIPGTNTTEYLWVYGGDGGDGATGGGRGGDAKNGKMTGGDGATGFYIYGGTGGDGTLGVKGRGGNGGNISNVLVIVGASNSESQFFSGDGGDSRGANGGNAGSVINVKMTEKRDTSGLFEFSTGDGGDVVAGDGKGGNGGALIGSSFTKTGGSGLPNTEDLEIFTGSGGDGHGNGNGGNGGAMTGFKLDLQKSVDELTFFTGDGGSAGTTARSGGKGGAMTGTKFTAAGSFGSDPNIHAGNGGDADGPGAKGGDSGFIKGFTANAPLASILINDGTQAGDGGSGAQSKGGKGGDVSGVKGSFGTLSIFAPSGGSSAGTGGHGGSIKGLKVTAITDFVRLIKAGDGGNGAITAGAGGSVVNVKVAGDIGDFASVFGVSSDPGNMGGLIAGQGGNFGPGSGAVDPTKNGSILGVNAMHIAAILAGAPTADNLTADNAVKKISNLTGVNVIGADLDPPGFDFIDNPAGPNPANGVFLLGDGDIALDGLVIVKAGGFTGPHPAPLKLIEV
jgi:hypothetical protein